MQPGVNRNTYENSRNKGPCLDLQP